MVVWAGCLSSLRPHEMQAGEMKADLTSLFSLRALLGFLLAEPNGDQSQEGSLRQSSVEKDGGQGELTNTLKKRLDPQ